MILSTLFAFAALLTVFCGRRNPAVGLAVVASMVLLLMFSSS